MKRLLVVCAILLLPAAVFAQVQVGATALYNFPYFVDAGPEGIDASDFTFGADARIRIFVFQASALALFTPGYTDALDNEVAGNIDLIIDGGLSFDLLMFRLGVGVGPSLRINLEPGADPTGIGLNAKATAEVMLGKLAIGLSYLNQFEFDFADANQLLDQDYSQGLFGVSLLFTL
jgi:hypothetical protein